MVNGYSKTSPSLVLIVAKMVYTILTINMADWARPSNATGIIQGPKRSSVSKLKLILLKLCILDKAKLSKSNMFGRNPPKKKGS